EVSIDFPTLLAPLSLERRAKAFRTKSTISLSYSYQDKVEYARGIFLATWGYNWRKGRFSQTFNPIEINTVQMLRVSPWFQENLNALSTSNLRLKYQYEDHFIFDWRYQLVYSDQKPGVSTDFNFFRFNAETAGNLLYGIAKAVGAQKNANGQYQVFGLPFSQYARMDMDYKHHFVFGKDAALVFRVLVGVGYSYLNAQSLPYEKSFYAGGSTTLRAWPLYQVGPGSYSNPNNYRMERLGDMTIILNLEQRFPIIAGLKGAVFLDAGNIWLLKDNPEFEGGLFQFNKFYKDMTFGTGFGLRYDFNFFIIRVDMGIPLYSPAQPTGQRWVVERLVGKDLVFNFGIGYPF
ncbi:MAG: BamA/TamA family outer membrane protein, partial [Bacteroidales bacterium]|nr:BamA/TamA family outer membrane protein [Bacteroidales bacterium]